MNNNNKQDIINIIKESYSRDLRKQVVKTLQKEEQQSQKPDYKIINQIFSYVLKELHWTIVESTQQWDHTPLEIMKETFPKIEHTTWYKEQILTAKKMIKTEVTDTVKS